MCVAMSEFVLQCDMKGYAFRVIWGIRIIDFIFFIFNFQLIDPKIYIVKYI